MVKFWLDPKLQSKLPCYGSVLASGMDLCSAEDVEIFPGGVMLVHTGVWLADLDPNYELQVRSRSGNTLNRRFMVANQPGTVDADYRGEIAVIVFYPYSPTKETLEIKVGQKIAQLVICPVVRTTIERVDQINNPTERGSKGFGSTGI